MATSTQEKKKRKELWLKKLGTHIATLRKERGMTGSDLGAKIGVYKQDIGRIEKAEFTPSIWRIKEIADALEISLYDLFKGIEE